MNNMYDQFVNFFKSGIKYKKQKLIGIEIEHFIVDKNTNEAVSYYGSNGIKTILTDLMKFYRESNPIFDEDIIGFYSKDFDITLEPAAQLEISIKPCEKIENIEKIYKNFLDNINHILNKLDYKIMDSSCQYKSNVMNIKTIPKKRYEFMENYFEKINSNGINMMKGTCSLQASIDYFSENDFRKKFQVAYFLTPFLKLISNNSNCYQGKYFETFLKRTEIYNDTDIKRCSIPPNIFSETYGFENYAKYLCNVPLIFYTDNNNYYETTKTLKEISQNKKIDEDKILHTISIVFPDVRLKKFIEIRGADFMPFKYILSYCALIKGIFYSEKNLNILYDMMKDLKIDNDKIIDLEKNMIKFGWNSKIYGIQSKIFALKIIDLVRSETSDGELKYLEPLLSIIENKGLINIKNKSSNTRC